MWFHILHLQAQISSESKYFCTQTFIFSYSNLLGNLFFLVLVGFCCCCGNDFYFFIGRRFCYLNGTFLSSNLRVSFIYSMIQFLKHFTFFLAFSILTFSKKYKNVNTICIHEIFKFTKWKNINSSLPSNCFT